MDSAVIAALVTTVVGGIFLLLQKLVDKRYNRAKEAVSKNSADVENLTQVVQGFKSLNEQYQTRLKEQDSYIRQLEAKVAQLEEGTHNA